MIDPRYGVASSPRVVEPGQPVPKGGGAYRIGQPYMIGGRVYVPQEDPNYRAEGIDPSQMGSKEIEEAIIAKVHERYDQKAYTRTTRAHGST